MYVMNCLLTINSWHFTLFEEMNSFELFYMEIARK